MTGKKNPFFQIYLLQWHLAGSSPGFLSQLERQNAEHHFLHSGNLARLVLLGGRAGLVHPALRVGHDCVVSGRLALRRHAQHREHLQVELLVLGGGFAEVVEQFVAGFPPRRFLIPGPPGTRGRSVRCRDQPNLRRLQPQGCHPWSRSLAHALPWYWQQSPRALPRTGKPGTCWFSPQT